MNLLTRFRSEIDQVLINKDDTQSPKIKSLIQEGDLTSKEKEILEYIRLNPGITKQQIVNYFDLEGLAKHSRVTIFKVTKNLEKDGLIVVSPDRNNSQIHHLYINNESTLSLLIQDIKTFKNAFFVLLNKAKERYAEFEEEKADDPSYFYNDCSITMSKHLFYIYKYFIDVNIIHILYNWSHRTDPQISVKTASIFFNEIKEIQLRLSDAMNEVKKIEDQYDFKDFARSLFSGQYYRMFEMVSSFTDYVTYYLIDMFGFFKHWNMEEEIRNMLYCLLKLHSSFLPTEDIFLELKDKGIVLKEFSR